MPLLKQSSGKALLCRRYQNEKRLPSSQSSSTSSPSAVACRIQLAMSSGKVRRQPPPPPSPSPTNKALLSLAFWPSSSKHSVEELRLGGCSLICHSFLSSSSSPSAECPLAGNGDRHPDRGGRAAGCRAQRQAHHHAHPVRHHRRGQAAGKPSPSSRHSAGRRPHPQGQQQADGGRADVLPPAPLRAAPRLHHHRPRRGEGQGAQRPSVRPPPPFNKRPFRNIPAERAKFIQRRDGYSYFVAKLTLVPGQKLGLAIKHYQNRVLVSKAEPGSVAGVELQVRGGEGRGNSQVGDHLVDVNAVPVTDKDVARGLLIKALQARPSPSLRTCSKAAT